MIKNKEEKILNYTLRTLDINEICPNSIEGVIISIDNGKLRADIPSTMTSGVFQHWGKRKGGIFSKDIKRYIKGNPCGIYILMEGEGEGKRIILRLIDDEEFPDFEIKELVDGKVKDKPYMVLKTLGPEENLTSTLRYIKEIEIIDEEIDPIDTSQDEDSSVQNMQLFAD
jgi:hypothetical protein